MDYERFVEGVKAAFLEIMDPHIKAVDPSPGFEGGKRFDRVWVFNFGPGPQVDPTHYRSMFASFVERFGDIETAHINIPKSAPVEWMHHGFVMYLESICDPRGQALLGRLIFRRMP
jgi:hypothetical protein